MSASESTPKVLAADGLSTFPMAHESIENPGWMVTYHPKPEQYEPNEWFHMVKCMHTGKGHVVKDVLAACEFHDDGPYPLKSRIKTWGVEVTWHSR